MEFTGVGGGIMLAIAAALWLVYLLPNWFKRREYLATERNAVRLQQTIRILAETSEVPAVVRAEAVARAAPVAARPALPAADRPASSAGRPALPAARTTSGRGLAARRLRRTRALTSVVLLVSLAVATSQLWLMVAAAAGSWLVLGASGLAVFSAFALLGRFARIAKARRNLPAPAARGTSSLLEYDFADEPAGWTPVPVPRPLYLSRAPAAEQPVVDPVFELESAAAAAERALRSVEQPAAVVPLPALVGSPSPSRFASMGIVDAASSGAPDLDAVLARRRAAG